MQIETTSFEPADSASETKGALDELMRAFESFKESNDARLEEIEKNAAADVLLEDKLTRLNDEMTRLGKIVQRPTLDGTESQPEDNIEQRAAFVRFLRTGEVDMTALHESKALSLTDTEGGLLVPDLVVTELNRRLAKRSVMRQIATVQQLAVGNDFTYVSNAGNVSASWTTEKAAKTSGTTPSFTEQSIKLFEVYALQAATGHFLQDTNIDVEAWLIDSMLQAFADLESQEFINGNGTARPKGLLNQTSSTAATPQAGKVGIVHSGAARTLDAATLYDKLIDLAFNLGTRYRQNAGFLMNGGVQGDVRKMKDGDDRYIWMPAQGQGMQPTLMGYPVHEDSYMPNVAANALPIAFGDFKSAFLIIEKPSTGLLRDPYTNQPYVQFLMSRRVGSDVIDKHAYRALKVAA